MSVRVAIAVMFLVVPAVAVAEVHIERSGVCALATLPARVTTLVDSPTTSGTIHVRTIGERSIRAEIWIADGDAPPRVIAGADCAALVDPIAVVVALLVRTLPAPSPTAATWTTLTTTDVPPPSIAVARGPRSRMLGAVELGGGATLDGDAVLLLGGRIGRGRAALAAELAIAPPAEQAIEMGHVAISSGRFTVAPCVEQWSVAVCGLVSVGWVHGRGMDGETATLPTTAAGARLEWRPMLGTRFGVRLFAEARYHVNRVEFLVDDVPVWRSAATETVLGIGGFVRIP